MAVNRGKQFEVELRKQFKDVPGVSIDRLHDQMTGYRGSQNICDFIVYKKPYEFYFECKTIHGNTLSIYGKDEGNKYGNITNNQWEGLLEKSTIPGVFAGIICWWVDKNVTRFLPIRMLDRWRSLGHRSIRYDENKWSMLGYTLRPILIRGKKKRVFFEYALEEFLNEF